MNTSSDQSSRPDHQRKLRVVQLRPGGSSLPGGGQALHKALVTGRVGQCWCVKFLTQEADVTALRAAGCLLQPQIGDTVLLLHDAGGDEHYILNILARESTQRVLDFPGDARLKTEGTLQLQGTELDMQGDNETRIRSKRLSLAAASAGMCFNRLELLAGLLDAGVQNVHAVGQRLHLAAAHLVSRLGRAVRSTGYELHRASRLRTEVEKSCTLKAGSAAILAKEDVTIDAEKIDIG